MNLWEDSGDDLLHCLNLICSSVARKIMPRPGQLWMYSDRSPAFFAAFQNISLNSFSGMDRVQGSARRDSHSVRICSRRGSAATLSRRSRRGSAATLKRAAAAVEALRRRRSAPQQPSRLGGEDEARSSSRRRRAPAAEICPVLAFIICK